MRNWKRIAGTLCGILVSAVIVVTGCSKTADSQGAGDVEEAVSSGEPPTLTPEQALTRYLEGARDGDLEKMIAVCADDEAEELRELKNAPADQRSVWLETFQAWAPADAQIENTSVAGNRATITVSGTLQGKKQKMTASLVNEDGWKVKRIE